MRKNFATTGCDHTGSEYSPSYTHVRCTLCGAIGTDTGWGIASQAWFDNETIAKFYQSHGRLPEQPKTGFALAAAMYAAEPCRICGNLLTMDDVTAGAVFAGYSQDGTSRAVHKQCWENKPPMDQWQKP